MWITGLSSVTAGHAVWNRCQPPSSGFFFSARREVSVLQSIACTSTFTPARRNSWAETWLAALNCGMSVACISTIGSLLYPASASSSFAFSKSCVISRSAPVALPYSVSQINIAGQTLKEPGKALEAVR